MVDTFFSVYHHFTISAVADSLVFLILILFLPALGADKAKSASEKADHYPGNDGKAPAEALGDEGDTVGGEGASDIGAGIDNSRCR